MKEFVLISSAEENKHHFPGIKRWQQPVAQRKLQKPTEAWTDTPGRAAAELKKEGGQERALPSSQPINERNTCSWHTRARGYIWNRRQSHAPHFLAVGKILLLLQMPLINAVTPEETVRDGRRAKVRAQKICGAHEPQWNPGQRNAKIKISTKLFKVFKNTSMTTIYPTADPEVKVTEILECMFGTNMNIPGHATTRVLTFTRLKVGRPPESAFLAWGLKTHLAGKLALVFKVLRKTFSINHFSSNRNISNHSLRTHWC